MREKEGELPTVRRKVGEEGCWQSLGERQQQSEYHEAIDFKTEV
jgi:hypothetical protein